MGASPTSATCASSLVARLLGAVLTLFSSRSLNSFLSPTEAAADSSFRSADPMQLDPSTHGGMDTNAFFGFPMGAEITEDWCVQFSSWWLLGRTLMLVTSS